VVHPYLRALQANQPAAYYKTTFRQNKHTGALTPINTEVSLYLLQPHLQTTLSHTTHW
jgi:hypothetical protein